MDETCKDRLVVCKDTGSTENHLDECHGRRTPFDRLNKHLQEMCIKCGYNVLYTCHESNFIAAQNYVSALEKHSRNSAEMKAARIEIRNTSLATAALEMMGRN